MWTICQLSFYESYFKFKTGIYALEKQEWHCINVPFLSTFYILMGKVIIEKRVFLNESIVGQKWTLPQKWSI